MSQPQPRRRHLLDPANPRPATPPGGMSLTSVQRWVMSSLAVTTVGHFAVGIVVAAAYVGDERAGADVGLLVVAGVLGMLGVAAGFLIHERSPLTPWLLVGTVPALVGAFFVL